MELEKVEINGETYYKDKQYKEFRAVDIPRYDFDEVYICNSCGEYFLEPFTKVTQGGRDTEQCCPKCMSNAIITVEDDEKNIGG